MAEDEDQVARLQREMAGLRVCLRAFLSLDPTYTKVPLERLDEIAEGGNRLAGVIARARRALGEA